MQPMNFLIAMKLKLYMIYFGGGEIVDDMTIRLQQVCHCTLI